MAGFDIDAMRAAVRQCERNIETFETAIRKEQSTQAEYRKIIRKLEEREASQARAVIAVTRESDDDDLG